MTARKILQFYCHQVLKVEATKAPSRHKSLQLGTLRVQKGTINYTLLYAQYITIIALKVEIDNFQMDKPLSNQWYWQRTSSNLDLNCPYTHNKTRTCIYSMPFSRTYKYYTYHCFACKMMMMIHVHCLETKRVLLPVSNPLFLPTVYEWMILNHRHRQFYDYCPHFLMLPVKTT